MPFMIRLATPSDIPVIERIVSDAYTPYIARIGTVPGPMRDDYAKRVAEKVVHVSEEAEVIQAVLVLIPEPDCLLLDNIAVSPAAQGKGLGRVLMHFAESFAREAGLARIRLYTQEKMTENIAIYFRYGYVETHRAEELGLRRVFMRKSLLST